MNRRFVRILVEFFETALEISSYIAHLLLCIFGVQSGSFFSTIREVYSIFFHQLHQIISQVLACQTHLLNCMREGESFVDRDSRSQRVA